MEKFKKYLEKCNSENLTTTLTLLQKPYVIKLDETDVIYTNSLLRDISYERGLFYIEALESGTCYFSNANTYNKLNLEYSFDGITYTTWEDCGVKLTVSAGDKLYLRGDNEFGISLRSDNTSGSFTVVTKAFNSTFKFNIYGDLMALIGNHPLPRYGFYCIFAGSNVQYLETIPNEDAYYGMYGMFQYSNLLQIGYLPTITVTELYAMANMFNNCASLTSINGNSVIFDNLGDYSCYYMFNYCTKLSKIPKLQFTGNIGNYGCNYMFYTCVALVDLNVEFNVDSIGSNGCSSMFYYKGLNSATSGNINLKITAKTVNSNGFANFLMYHKNTKSINIEIDVDTVDPYGLAYLCQYNYYDAYNLTGYINIGIVNNYGCLYMFSLNYYLKNTIPIKIENVGYYGCAYMFAYGNNISDFLGITATNVGEYGFYDFMYTYNGNGPTLYSVLITCSGNINIKNAGKYACYYLMGGRYFIKSPKIICTYAGYYSFYYTFYSCRIEEFDDIVVDYAGAYSFASFYDSSDRTIVKKVNNIICNLAGYYAFRSMFASCYYLESVGLILINKMLTEGINYTGTYNYACLGMFSGCTSLTSINLKLKYIGSYSCLGMFSGCSKLSTINDDAFSNLSYVGEYGLHSCFLHCSLLKTLPYIKSNYVGYCGMYSMVAYSSIEVVEGIEIGTCYDYALQCMFSNSYYTELVNSTYVLKGYLKRIKKLHIDYAGSNIFDSMFNNNKDIEIIDSFKVKKLNPNKVNHLTSAFSGCGKLLSINSDCIEDIPQLYDGSCNYMFAGCSSLVSKINLPLVETIPELCYSYMFANCSKMTLASDKVYATTIELKGCEYMYSNCNSISEFPLLPATLLAPYCYHNMFINCTSASHPIELPAQNLYTSCYQGMFNGCTSLITTMPLLAEVLAPYCYSNMFEGCSYISLTPELNSTSLAVGCYSNMFSKCTGLVEIMSELPALEIYNECYKNMFTGCIQITTTPTLPATELKDSCYEAMFSGCTNIEYAPQLHAVLLKSLCYKLMFAGCSKINYIVADFANYEESFVENWLYGVASSGTIVKTNTWDIIGPSGIPEGWNETISTEWGIVESVLDTAYADKIAARTDTQVTVSYQTKKTYTNEELELLFEDDPITYYKNIIIGENETGDIRTIEGTFLHNNKLEVQYSITQKATDAELIVDLNNQWVNSTKTLSDYDVYMSNSNYNVNSGFATMKITFEGIPEFKVYINSYAESSFDYTIAWNLDVAAPTSNPSASSSNVYATTSNKLSNPTSISSFTELSYPNDGLRHFVCITYRKDSSVNSGDDRGYVAISKTLI